MSVHHIRRHYSVSKNEHGVPVVTFDFRAIVETTPQQVFMGILDALEDGVEYGVQFTLEGMPVLHTQNLVPAEHVVDVIATACQNVVRDMR